MPPPPPLLAKMHWNKKVALSMGGGVNMYLGKERYEYTIVSTVIALNYISIIKVPSGQIGSA